MEYAPAKVGRVFVVRFDNHDDLKDGIARLAKKEKIKTGVVHFIGALRKGVLVSGPKADAIPPAPIKYIVSGVHEVVGVGTIFPGVDGPSVHLHGALGRRKKALVGCLRDNSSVFLLIEAIVMELTGIKLEKKLHPKQQVSILRFLNK